MRVTRKQFEMFERPNRYGSREGAERYALVTWLRSYGMDVFRVGDQNKVNGNLLSTVEMRHVAKRLGWRNE